MQRTIRELRQARGLKQYELARRADVPISQLSKIENLHQGAPPPVVARLCQVLECSAEDLHLASLRPAGGQPKVARDELSRFSRSPALSPRPDWTSAARLFTLRRQAPQFMRRLEPVAAQFRDYLEEVPSDSSNETILQLLELSRGALTTRLSTSQLGFDLWPVCDESGRGACTCLRPALVTADWILLFQVRVIASGRRWRMDGLLLVREPEHIFLDLEVDGDGHDHSEDEVRRRALGMVSLRISGNDLLKGPSLTQRLQAMGYCQGRGRGARR